MNCCVKNFVTVYGLEYVLAEPRLVITRENRPGANAMQGLSSLQPTVQTNQIVESFYVMICSYHTNCQPHWTHAFL